MWSVKVLLLMFLFDIIDDFVLQPICLSKLKQKRYWIEECKKYNLNISKYDTDYITALLIHGLSWSIMIHVPLMFLGGIRDDFFLLLSVLFNAVIHAIIDDLKANKLKINLDVDQCLHGFQIVITWIVFSLISHYQLFYQL
jgi:hypothetical protein